jgi:3-methyladenine DNA glycosylase Tag
VEYLLSPASGVVRNFRKVSATVENAARFLAVREEFGSFRRYLRSLDGQPYAVRVKDLKRRFKHVGDTGAFVFLYSVGEQVPAWADRKVSGRKPVTQADAALRERPS